MKRNKRKNTEVFINECIEVRGYKYDYSLVSYKNNKQKVKIICKDHGIFEQTPNNHLSKLQDCPKCSDMYFDIKSNDEILSDFKKIHGDKYGYSKFCKINKINLVRIKFDDDIKKKIYECLS